MRLLIFRLSAMGDAALTVPALRAVLEPNAEISATLVTRRAFVPFFEDIPRLELYTPDLKNYKGLCGLRGLYREIRRKGTYDAVIDLHDVLRTKVLRFFFRRAGLPVYVIDKGRKEKRDLVKGKIFRPLPHTVERYLDVFRAAGVKTHLTEGPWIRIKETEKEKISGSPALGIAPLARHALKRWPMDRMTTLLQLLAEQHPQVRFYLLGGPEEASQLEILAAATGGRAILTVRLPLPKQLALMRQMDAVISMDSANMHLASLLGVPVVSVWGATHPYAGFAPWGSDETLQVQIPKGELPCRPCTVYGKGSCRRGDLACLRRITPEMVAEKVDKALTGKL